jgi:hypothetical protein
MNYSKNDFICAYPDPTRDAHYTCLALEDNGNVIQVHPTQNGHVFENMIEWRDSIPQCSYITPRIIIRPFKDAMVV